MQALHFGAGNIGRGFIGYLLNKTGYDVCFVDVNEEIIKSINETNSYTIELLDDNSTRKTVSPVSALNSIKEKEKVIQAIVDADLITTSVGVENLSKIAGTIAEGLVKRIKENKTKLDVIANENAVNASSTLKQEIKNNLSSKEMEKITEFVGFPNSAIDRLALSKETENGEIALVEPFYEWVINESEIKNTKLHPIEDVIYVDNLEAYINRKFYLINMAHAATAYIGYRAGENTIQSTLANSKMRKFIREVLNEVKNYIVIDSHFSDEELDLPLKHLSIVVSAAFLFDNPKDEEAVRLQEYIEENGINDAITNFTGIEKEELQEKILNGYSKIKDIGINKLINDLV